MLIVSVDTLIVPVDIGQRSHRTRGIKWKSSCSVTPTIC